MVRQEQQQGQTLPLQVLRPIPRIKVERVRRVQVALAEAGPRTQHLALLAALAGQRRRQLQEAEAARQGKARQAVSVSPGRQVLGELAAKVMARLHH